MQIKGNIFLNYFRKRTILPTYAELVQYAQEKQHLSVKENTQNVETDAAQSIEQTVEV